MFLVGLPKIEKNILNDSNLDVKIDQLSSIVNLEKDIVFNFDGNRWSDNNNNIYINPL